jgi:hypothetical protein
MVQARIYYHCGLVQHSFEVEFTGEFTAYVVPGLWYDARIF